MRGAAVQEVIDNAHHLLVGLCRVIDGVESLSTLNLLPTICAVAGLFALPYDCPVNDNLFDSFEFDFSKYSH